MFLPWHFKPSILFPLFLPRLFYLACLLLAGSEDFDSHPYVFPTISLTSLLVVAWLWLCWDGGLCLCFYLPGPACLFTVTDLLILTCHSKGVLWVGLVQNFFLHVFRGILSSLESQPWFFHSFFLGCWMGRSPQKNQKNRFEAPQRRQRLQREASTKQHRWVMQLRWLREDIWAIDKNRGNHPDEG